MTAKTATTEFNIHDRIHRNLSSDTINAIRLFVSYLSKAELDNVSKVILYGSRARGDHRPDSDIDIAVIFHHANPDEAVRHKLQMRLSEIRSEAMLQADIPVSAIALWETQVHHPEAQNNPYFFHDINAEGIDVDNLL